MPDNTVKVSIICTAYNHEGLIQSALDGFVMQKTDFPFEVLVHDDASTDGTARIIRQYAKDYPDIIVPIYQTENQWSKGVKITNDIILPKARGRYLAFCEGDDYWTDCHKLQRQVEFLDKHPDYVACVHNSVVHDCTGRQKDSLHVQNDCDHDVSFEMIVGGMHCAYQTSALVVRREWNTNLPDFYDIAVSYGFGDWPKAIWFSLNGKIRFFREAMSTYRLMSNPTAWSAQDFSVRRRLRNLEGNVAMLEAVKGHVSQERIALLDDKILQIRFHMLQLQENYSELRKPPFDRLWKQQSLAQRLKIRVKEKLPGLYHRIRRIRE